MDARPVVTVQHGEAVPTQLDSISADAELRMVTSARLAEGIAGADVLFLYDFSSPALESVWSAADALRWVQVAAIGVDAVMFDELIDSDVVVTNSRGIFEEPIAEYVLGQILAFAKDFRRSWEAQCDGRWQHFDTERIAGGSVTVVGPGPVGRAIARLLRAVGMSVRGVGRSEREDPDFGTVTTDVLAAVGDADYVVLAAPLTPQTRGMVGADVLGAMRPTARLINVGRGELVDTDALVSALQAGVIAGAALDVVDPEPLPVGHPLWTAPNVRLTPHNSGDIQGWRNMLQQQFVANFRRYAAGQPLHNVVDKRSVSATAQSGERRT
ncbi:hydroxyacid dehydrogenase [Mycolicibacter longobardus]|uniref:Hydroxyacid dehydrogenase n=1 Tax=Mycolicibacter longobardus TaxID=1108812 RepID=A0A1X1YKP8_9MYCO|nr:hydroxyacid dehydrogenase [Mycolicibacter longobardus]